LPNFQFNEFVDFYENREKQSQSLMAEFQDNGKKMFDMIKKQRTASENFIELIAKDADLNLDYLLKKIGYEKLRKTRMKIRTQRIQQNLSGKRPQVQYKTMDRMRAQRSVNDLKVRQKSMKIIDIREQNRKVKDMQRKAKEQMERSRIKAREQGW